MGDRAERFRQRGQAVREAAAEPGVTVQGYLRGQAERRAGQLAASTFGSLPAGLVPVLPGARLVHVDSLGRFRQAVGTLEIAVLQSKTLDA